MGVAYEKWKNSGLEILAFPCNQFGGQEAGTHEEIIEFVETNFHTTFPLMEKIEVNGENCHPLFAFLRNGSEELFDPKTGKAQVIPWNFAKFFVNSDGKVIKYFNPKVKLE